MGKKKQQEHVQKSMAQMVSKAALAQLWPHITNFVQSNIQRLGSQLALQQASTLETLFSRVIVLEQILIEKYGYTADDLAVRVSQVEDEKEGLTLLSNNELLQKGDVVRLLIKTKPKDKEEFQGETRLKVYSTGSGETLGLELEEPMIGMKTGESKLIEFGKDKSMVAEVTINRISRKPTEEISKSEGTDANQNEG